MSRQLDRRTAFFAVVFCLCIRSLPEGVARAETVRIMSFNLWHGGDAGQQPLKKTIDVIRAAKADVVGLQETHGHAPEGKPRPDRAAEIASQLGRNRCRRNVERNHRSVIDSARRNRPRPMNNKGNTDSTFAQHPLFTVERFIQ